MYGHRMVEFKSNCFGKCHIFALIKILLLLYNVLLGDQIKSLSVRYSLRTYCRSVYLLTTSCKVANSK